MQKLYNTKHQHSEKLDNENHSNEKTNRIQEAVSKDAQSYVLFVLNNMDQGQWGKRSCNKEPLTMEGFS